LTWEKGRHLWKFGGDVTAFRFHSGVIPDYGYFQFTGAFTGGTTASGFADFFCSDCRSLSADPILW